MSSSSSTAGGAQTPRLLSLKIWRYQNDDSIQLVDFENLAFLPWHVRITGMPTQQLLFHTRTVMNRMEPGKRLTVKLDDQEMGNCHTYVLPNGLGATVVCSTAYPMRVAYTLISEALRAFQADPNNQQWQRMTADAKMTFNEGQSLFDRFQNPMEADKISKIEKELDDVKDTVVRAMDDVLRRGEKLEDLENKSRDVTAAAATFRRQAAANNSCCGQYT